MADQCCPHRTVVVKLWHTLIRRNVITQLGCHLNLLILLQDINDIIMTHKVDHFGGTPCKSS